MLTLREYQKEAVAGVVSLWQKGVQNVVGVAAPRTGKTVMSISCAVEANPNRVMFLVNGVTLARQAVETVHKFSDTYASFQDTGYIGGGRREYGHKFTAAMINSLLTTTDCGYVIDEYLKRGVPDLVIVDECHGSVTPRYMLLFKRLQEANPNVKLLGITATPVRNDGLPLSLVYDKVGFFLTVEEGIHRGALVPPIYYGFNSPDGLIPRTENATELVFDRWCKYAGKRATVGFTSTVREAYEYADYWNKHGYSADVISGNDSMEEEAVKTQRLINGELIAVFNSNKLVEGWTAGPVSCVIFLRPANSPVLFPQAATRGLASYRCETYGQKQNCIVLDFRPADTRTIKTDHDILGTQFPTPEIVFKIFNQPVPERYKRKKLEIVKEEVEEDEGVRITNIAVIETDILKPAKEPFKRPRRLVIRCGSLEDKPILRRVFNHYMKRRTAKLPTIIDRGSYDLVVDNH